MAERRTKYLDLNVDYLNEILAKANITTIDMDKALERSHGYISKTRSIGKIMPTIARMICLLYNADYDRLTTKPQKEPVYPLQNTENEASDNTTIELFKECNKRVDRLVNSIAGLQYDSKVFYEQIDKLKAEIESLKNKSGNINLSTNEKAVLLLKQMVVYGSCELKDYESKATSYGISEQLQKFAIQHLGYAIVNKANSKWIIKK